MRASSLLRVRKPQEHGKVSFVELFFDLVFVFAITQLSHALLAQLTPLGLAQTSLLMLAVWWVWIFTSWVTNWLDPEQLPVRLALLVLMGLGLLMSSSLPQAFGERGLVFALAYVAMQVGRSLFFLWAVRGEPAMVRNFQRILVWLSLGGGFWIAGGLAEGETRLLLWGLGLALEYASPSLGFWVPGLGRSQSTDWNVEGGHLSERCALFIIIALGESVLVTGATFAEMPWSAATVGAFLASFVGSLAMWWLYFDSVAETGSHRIANARDPGRLARLVYTYIHLLPVAGIVVTAVADEMVLAHPQGHGSGIATAAILGGTALYLLGSLLFRWTIGGQLPRSCLLGLLALAALLPLASHLAPLWLSLATSTVLVLIAAWEASERHRRQCGTARPQSAH